MRRWRAIAFDQIAGEAELFTQPDAARLAREEAVGSALDQESAHLLGEDGAADARPALDEHDLGNRDASLEAQGGGEAGDPAADDDDAAHVRAESHGAARSSITSTSVAMYTRVVVQRRRTLEPYAQARRRPRAPSRRCRRGSRRGRTRSPTGMLMMSLTPSAASAAMWSSICGPSHGSGVRPADWKLHDQRSAPRPACSATSRAVSRNCRSYGSPAARIRTGRLCALKTTCTRSRCSSGQRERPSSHARRERLDQLGSIVVAVHVLERDLAAVEVESGGDLVGVFRDGQRAVVRVRARR